MGVRVSVGSRFFLLNKSSMFLSCGISEKFLEILSGGMLCISLGRISRYFCCRVIYLSDFSDKKKRIFLGSIVFEGECKEGRLWLVIKHLAGNTWFSQFSERALPCMEWDIFAPTPLWQ